MAKPDIDTCRDYIWKIIVEKQFTVDENEKSNHANQAEKAKILQQMEDLLKVNEKVTIVKHKSKSESKSPK